MPAERLQKIMAAAGVGSRRTCEELITAGRVQVNGAPVTELGVKADPRRDRIVVDGKRLEFKLDHLYFKVHKPRGVLSDTTDDEGERRTVIDLLPPDTGRVFPVGRLDLHSEGLVLLTDDGELANRLTHPRYQHPKTYFVLVETLPSLEALTQLRTGVDLPEGHSAPALVTIAEQLPEELQLSKGPTEGVWLRIVLREGKKRQIRHMTAAVGYPALRLVRWSIGSLTLGRLGLGHYAVLTPGEIGALRRMAGLAAAEIPQEKPARTATRDFRHKPARPAGGTGEPVRRKFGARPASKSQFAGAGRTSKAPSTGTRPTNKPHFASDGPTSDAPPTDARPTDARPASKSQFARARPGSKASSIGARPANRPQSASSKPARKGPSAGARPASKSQFAGARPASKASPAGARPASKPQAASARRTPATPVRDVSKRPPRKPSAPNKRSSESHG